LHPTTGNTLDQVCQAEHLTGIVYKSGSVCRKRPDLTYRNRFYERLRTLNTIGVIAARAPAIVAFLYLNRNHNGDCSLLSNTTALSSSAAG
jgi:hypothetical protein